MEDDDVYDDLPNFDFGSDAEKLKQQNEKLQEHIASLETDVEKCCATILKMKETQNNLARNISELFKTAKSELERKDQRLADLQRQLDDVLLRRKEFGSYKRSDNSSSANWGPLITVEKDPRHQVDSKPSTPARLLKHSNETKHSRVSPSRSPNESNPKRYRRDHDESRGSRQQNRSRSRSRDRYRNTHRDRSTERNNRYKYNRERSSERRRPDSKRNFPMDSKPNERNGRNEETRNHDRDKRRKVDNFETRNSREELTCNAAEFRKIEKRKSDSDETIGFPDDLTQGFQLEKDVVSKSNLTSISKIESNSKPQLGTVKERDAPVKGSNKTMPSKKREGGKTSSEPRIDEVTRKFNDAEKLRRKVLDEGKGAGRTNAVLGCKIVKRRATNAECKFAGTGNRDEINKKISENPVEIKESETKKKKLSEDNRKFKDDRIEKPKECLSDKSESVADSLRTHKIERLKGSLPDLNIFGNLPITQKMPDKEDDPVETRRVEDSSLPAPTTKVNFLHAEAVKDMDDIASLKKPVQVLRRRTSSLLPDSEDLIKKLVLQEEKECNGGVKKRKKKKEAEKPQKKTSTLLKELFDDDSKIGESVSSEEKIKQTSDVKKDNDESSTQDATNINNITAVSIIIRAVKLDETNETNLGGETEDAINSSSVKTDVTKTVPKKATKEKKVETKIREISPPNEAIGRVLRSATRRNQETSPIPVQDNSTNVKKKSPQKSLKSPIKQTANNLEVKWPDEDSLPVLHLSEAVNFPKSLLDMTHIDLDDDQAVMPDNLENLITSTLDVDNANLSQHPSAISDLELLRSDLNLSCDNGNGDHPQLSDVAEEVVSSPLTSNQTNSGPVSVSNSGGRRRRRWCTITMVE